MWAARQNPFWRFCNPMTEQLTDLLNKANKSHKLSLMLYVGLLLTVVVETWWLNPPPGSILMISAIQLIPLLLPLYGLIKRQPRASAWLCFILCFYFMSGVLDAWFQPEVLNGWLMTGFSSLLFVSAMMFTRWQGKANNLASQQVVSQSA